MRYYVRAYKQQIRLDLEYPCFILVSSVWDDFGFKTSFDLQFYYDRNERFVIGGVKIMDINLEEDGGFTILPEYFEELNENFASLGCDVEYYENLFKLKEKYNVNINNTFDELNDLANMPGLYDKFHNTNAFNNSLLREREAKTALLLGENIINNLPETSIIDFKFTTKLKNALTPHIVHFEFDKKNILPRRTFAIIGKNGTGKTIFLSNLANTLNYSKDKNFSNVLNSKKNIKLEEHEIGEFDTALGPPFRKIIALSYSMFDTFRRPKPSKRFSYIYCGLRNQNDEIDKKELVKRHIESLKSINKQTRGEVWFNTLSKFVDLRNLGYNIQEYIFHINNINEIEEYNILNLSSGHSILIYTITELIANLSKNSLVLFDEPENHLHPNAIANLIDSINELMIQFDAFAIISTHSPIVIQQIPAKNVYVFERDENTAYTRPLDIESFGENLTTISDHIFETIEVKDGYKATLKKLTTDNTYEQILEMFDNKLSLNSKIYLSSIIDKNQR